MNLRLRLPVVAAMMACGVVLQGCGGGGKAAGTTAGPKGTTAPPVTTPAPPVACDKAALTKCVTPTGDAAAQCAILLGALPCMTKVPGCSPTDEIAAMAPYIVQMGKCAAIKCNVADLAKCAKPPPTSDPRKMCEWASDAQTCFTETAPDCTPAENPYLTTVEAALAACATETCDAAVLEKCVAPIPGSTPADACKNLADAKTCIGAEAKICIATDITPFMDALKPGLAVCESLAGQGACAEDLKKCVPLSPDVDTVCQDIAKAAACLAVSPSANCDAAAQAAAVTSLASAAAVCKNADPAACIAAGKAIVKCTTDFKEAVAASGFDPAAIAKDPTNIANIAKLMTLCKPVKAAEACTAEAVLGCQQDVPEVQETLALIKTLAAFCPGTALVV